jgi:uncharacterized protein YutE (UPF0331/DUF86 family)
MNDVIINKIQSIQRCIKRAREIYKNNKNDFLENFDAQDASVLNILRACELSIDLANYIIKKEKLGIPSSSAESFELLAKSHFIDTILSDKMKKMVGFRNIAVHEYQKVNYEIVESVITGKLDDIIIFTEKMIQIKQENTQD